jgi:hypothetical protein
MATPAVADRLKNRLGKKIILKTTTIFFSIDFVNQYEIIGSSP